MDLLAKTMATVESENTSTIPMFDDKINTQVESTDKIELVVTANKINSVAFFALDALSIDLELTNNISGLVVFTETINLLQDLSTSWSDYWFQDISFKRDVISKTFPFYANASLKITIHKTGSTAKCGMCVIGRRRFVGLTLPGVSLGVEDYSVVERDDVTGDIALRQGKWSKRGEFDIKIGRGGGDQVLKMLIAVRGKPSVWIGDNKNKIESALIYGFSSDFFTIWNTPRNIFGSIEITGLI